MTDLITYPTWKRYLVLAHVVSELGVKERRQAFMLCRNAKQSPNASDVFMPHFGFTVSEFAVWHTLATDRKPRRTSGVVGAGKKNSSRTPFKRDA